MDSAAHAPQIAMRCPQTSTGLASSQTLRGKSWTGAEGRAPARSLRLIARRPPRTEVAAPRRAHWWRHRYADRDHATAYKAGIPSRRLIWQQSGPTRVLPVGGLHLAAACSHRVLRPGRRSCRQSPGLAHISRSADLRGGYHCCQGRSVNSGSSAAGIDDDALDEAAHDLLARFDYRLRWNEPWWW